MEAFVGEFWPERFTPALSPHLSPLTGALRGRGRKELWKLSCLGPSLHAITGVGFGGGVLTVGPVASQDDLDRLGAAGGFRYFRPGREQGFHDTGVVARFAMPPVL